jgi:hypothetical protein
VNRTIPPGEHAVVTHEGPRKAAARGISIRPMSAQGLRDRDEPAASPGMIRYAAEHWGCGRDRLHADAAISVSYRNATVTIDRPPVAKAAVSRRRSAKPATVSASALAQHLDCSRSYIRKLEAEGVIQRQGDGSRSMRRVRPICGSCGASGSNRRAVRQTLIFSGRRPS